MALFKHVLIDRFRAVITDFGESRHVDRSAVMTHIGTLYWTAPEILAKSDFDESADVYSFGVVLYELITGKLPYAGIPDSVIAHRVIVGTLRPEIPENAPLALKDPALRCLKSNRALRPTFKELAEQLQTAQRKLVEEEHMHVGNGSQRDLGSMNFQSRSNIRSVGSTLKRKQDVMASSRMLKELAGTAQPWRFEASKFGLDIYSISKANSDGGGTGGGGGKIGDSLRNIFGFKGSFSIPGDVETCAKIVGQWDRFQTEASGAMSRSILKRDSHSSFKIRSKDGFPMDGKSVREIPRADMVETVYHHFKLSWPYQDRDLVAKRYLVEESVNAATIVYSEGASEATESMLPETTAGRLSIFPSAYGILIEHDSSTSATNMVRLTFIATFDDKSNFPSGMISVGVVKSAVESWQNWC